MTTTSFHEIRLLPKIALGSSGGPEQHVDVTTLGSGFEKRNAPWAKSRRRYVLNTGPRPLAELYELLDFFEARKGPLHGFRWRDWMDYSSAAPGAQISANDQICQLLDEGSKIFQLQKKYGSGDYQTTRVINKPVAGTLKVSVDGKVLPSSNYIEDTTNGQIEITSSLTSNAIVRAGFEFDVPVRFDTEFLDIRLSGAETGILQNIALIELRLNAGSLS